MNQQVRVAPAREWKVAFTAADFERMMRLGAFADMRAELVGGELEKMMPALPAHGERNVRIGGTLDRLYGAAGLSVATDLAIRIDDTTVRAADIAVFPRDLPRDRVPDGSAILLVIEIADTTLSRDLGEKRKEYGAAGVAAYWVVDGAQRVTHCFQLDQSGEAYGAARIVPFGQALELPGIAETITIE